MSQHKYFGEGSEGNEVPTTHNTGNSNSTKKAATTLITPAPHLP